MRLLKTYLKPFAALVLACILLLFGQAMCDLTLPNVMSDIVNTGIQLGGVDEAAPAVLNQQAVDLLTLFMNDAEAGTFKNAYTPVEHGSDEETKLAKTYENIKDIDAVVLSEDADVQAVGDAYGKAAYAFMTFLKDYGAQTGQAVDTESGVQDMDMRQLYAVIPMLQQMPKETFSEAIDSAENAQSMIGSQVGATFTKLFYKELGVDLDAKQVRYIVMKGLEMLGIALLGVLAAVPADEVDTVDGFYFALEELCTVFGPAARPVFYIVIMVTMLTLVSNMVSWTLGANESLSASGLDSRSPFLAHRNAKYGTSDNLYIVMGVISTILIVLNFSSARMPTKFSGPSSPSAR